MSDETKALDHWLEQAPDRAVTFDRTAPIRPGDGQWLARCAVLMHAVLGPATFVTIPGMGARGDTRAEAFQALNDHIASESAAIMGAS